MRPVWVCGGFPGSRVGSSCAVAPPRYASDATVAVFVAMLLFVVPSQKPKFNFCSQTEAGKARAGLPPTRAGPAAGSAGVPGVRGSAGRKARSSEGDGKVRGTQQPFPGTVWCEISSLLLCKHLKLY